MHYSVGPVDKQTYAHSRQSHSHQQRGERLELAVAVWMTLVVLLRPDTETKARTIMSVTESDNEWTASAIMAELIAHRPATNSAREVREYIYRQTYKCNFAGLFDFLHLTYRNFVQIYVFIETSSCETCVFTVSTDSFRDAGSV